MGLRTPSHEQVHHPGDEGSCPSMPTESVNGKEFPNGDNSSVAGLGAFSIASPNKPVSHEGGHSSDPDPAMP